MAIFLVDWELSAKTLNVEKRAGERVWDEHARCMSIEFNSGRRGFGRVL
jgi:hypothetical protein